MGLCKPSDFENGNRRGPCEAESQSLGACSSKMSSAEAGKKQNTYVTGAE